MMVVPEGKTPPKLRNRTLFAQDVTSCCLGLTVWEGILHIQGVLKQISSLGL